MSDMEEQMDSTECSEEVKIMDRVVLLIEISVSKDGYEGRGGDKRERKTEPKSFPTFL